MTKVNIWFVVVWALMAVAGPARAQIKLPDWDKVQIKVQNLGHDVYMLQGFGSNMTAYTGPGGIFLVDDEYAPLSGKILVALAKITDRPVRYVINTHWHRDHRGGNENFARAGAIIISQAQARRTMRWAQLQKDSGNEDADITASPETLPQITYDKAMRLHLGDETIEIRYVPHVHTSGDSLVIFKKANVIATGDLFFNGFYPFIDVPFGGSIDNMIAFYDDLYAMADENTKIVPGHGPVANREDVRHDQAMLRDVRGRVAAAIEKGVSLKDLKAQKPLADLDAQWGDNLITADWMLDMVYKDLVRHGIGPARHDGL